MGATARCRFRRLGGWTILVHCCVGIAWQAHAANVLLYDFEQDPEGWENEAETPVQPYIVRGNARHGSGALAFDFRFSPSSRILHCRVKQGFLKGYSWEEFRGFSAWIYIPIRSGNWEARMFVRTGDSWKWCPGKSQKGLLPGWHRIEILRSEITAPEGIQDLGIQVILTSQETMVAQILIDQVEAITYP